MLRFKEYTQNIFEDTQKILGSLRKKYPQVAFETHNDDILGSHMWSMNNGKTVVKLHQKTLGHEMQHPNSETMMHHPFLGSIPHEIKEAEVTKRLVNGDWETLKKEFPEHDWDSSFTKKCKTLHSQMNQEDKEHFHKTGEFKNGEHENLAGLAHDIIISHDPKRYNRFLTQNYYE
jgi:hypothetical protein